MTKRTTTVSIDVEVLKEAHRLGLKISPICELSLKAAIAQLKQLDFAKPASG